jgi:hypothetical protein
LRIAGRGLFLMSLSFLLTDDIICPRVETPLGENESRHVDPSFS